MLRRTERIRRAKRMRHKPVVNVHVRLEGDDQPIPEAKPGETNIVVRFLDMSPAASYETPKVPAGENSTSLGDEKRTLEARGVVRQAPAAERREQERDNERGAGTVEQ
jgi:hypothetical protein